MKLLKMLTDGRRTAAVRRFVITSSRLAFIFVWKAVILFTLTMSIALTALAYNVALLAYRAIANRWSATVSRFFETYFYAELRERCSALEGRFDTVTGQLEGLKEALEEAANIQREVEDRTARRLELLNAVIAEGNALLETMVSAQEERLAAKEEVAEYGFVGTFCHHRQLHQQPNAASFYAAHSEDNHLCQLPLSPPHSSCNSHVQFASSLPTEASGGGRRSSCAFYSGSEESISCTSSPSPTSLADSPSQQAAPPPPPPPMPNFTYGKVSFKITPRTSANSASQTAVKGSGFAVTESEIAAMRNKLKKVPVERKETEDDDDENNSNYRFCKFECFFFNFYLTFFLSFFL